MTVVERHYATCGLTDSDGWRVGTIAGDGDSRRVRCRQGGGSGMTAGQTWRRDLGRDGGVGQLSGSLAEPTCCGTILYQPSRRLPACLLRLSLRST